MAALIQFATENPVLFGAMMTFMGAVAGGAATQVGYRLPAILDARDAGATPQLGLLQPPSCCPVCGHVLGFSEKIPLAGWFLAGGACQGCGVPLSRAYPLIEAAGALVGLLAAVRFGCTGEAILAACAGWTMLTCLATDLEARLIPDELSYPLAWAGLAASAAGWWPTAPVTAIFGYLAGFLTLYGMDIVMSRRLGGPRMAGGARAIGGGDMKLAAAIGAWTGPIVGGQVIGFVYLLNGLYRAAQRRGAGSAQAGDAVAIGPLFAVLGYAAILLPAAWIEALTSLEW